MIGNILCVGYTLVLQCRDEGIMRVPVLWRRKGKGLFSTRTAMTRGGRLEIQEADVSIRQFLNKFTQLKIHNRVNDQLEMPLLIIYTRCIQQN